MSRKQIDVGDVEAKLEELILGQKGEKKPGQLKLADVIDEAARWLDKEVSWGFLPGPMAIAAEALDYQGFHKMLQIPAQMAYNALKRAGKV